MKPILRPLTLAGAAIAAAAILGPAVLAQSGALAPPDSSAGAGGVSIFALFQQSFDLFTVLIVGGSVASLAIIVRCLIVVRRSNILPDETLDAVRTLTAERRWPDLQRFVSEDDSFLSHVLSETLPKLRNMPNAAREAVEIAAETETARRFKEVELLGVIGNLGPLLGLVGTVWGMIIAFTAIGETGGQAAASQLSIGIAKALFHTFLGLTLAIPSLLAYGVFRERLDRLCVEGSMQAADAVAAILAAGSGGAPAARASNGPAA